MNYEESVAYLEQAASFGIKPGLERIEAMLKKLGNPETAYKVIHVTGTNGKGSVVAMITSVLEMPSSGWGVTFPLICWTTPNGFISAAMIFPEKILPKQLPWCGKRRKKSLQTA